MKAKDKTDLVARVFKQKFDALMDCLVKCQLLGTGVAHMAVVEWLVLLFINGWFLLSTSNTGSLTPSAIAGRSEACHTPTSSLTWHRGTVSSQLNE